MPALGGGHSRHHFQTMAAQLQQLKEEEKEEGEEGGQEDGMEVDDDEQKEDSGSGTSSTGNGGTGSGSGSSAGRHSVCIDVLSRAVHCYICDEYVISDEPWLDRLRSELIDLETRELSEGGDIDNSDGGDDVAMEDVGRGTSSRRQVVVDDEGASAPMSTSAMAAATTPPGPQLPPMPYPPSPVPRRSPRLGPLTPPGCAGLRNLGNTCYMNSVLQALSHCTGFRSFFNDFLRAAAPLRLGHISGDGKGGTGGVAKVQLDRQTTARHLLKLQDSEEEPDRLALTEAIHGLLRVLWSGRWQVISPKAFVHAVWAHGGLFAARRQQDASEFLGFVLDRLDDELSPLNTPEEEGGDAKKKSTWPGTVLTDLFGIEQKQEVTCDDCGTKTVRTEPLLGLYLSLPPQQGRRKPVTLEECLDYLTASERLTGDNRFHCDKCNADTEATKTIALGRRPQTLLFSFRRTLWTKKKGLHKDERKVTFPLDFDASSLLSGHDGGEEDADCHYRLAAIVSHSGSSPQHGHYIAWCRVTAWSHVSSVADLSRRSISDGGKWYLFNDSTVTPAEESEVLNAEAFILLYERMRGPETDDVPMVGG